jgi:hypothetical protein
MNYLLAQCFNFDQISNLKNHDGIKKKTANLAIPTANATRNNPFGGNTKDGNHTVNGGPGSAVSGFATDRRPIKMRNFGMLKGVGA